MQNLPSTITNLDLSWTKATDETLNNITHLFKITTLILRETEITDTGLQYLSNSIINLDIRDCKNVLGDGMIYLPRNLIYLNLWGLDIGTKGLINLPPRIEKLLLIKNYAITNQDCHSLPRTLKVLNMFWTLVTEECIIGMPKSLRKLDLSHCKIKSEMMKRIPELLPNLKKLYLAKYNSNDIKELQNSMVDLKIFVATVAC